MRIHGTDPANRSGTSICTATDDGNRRFGQCHDFHTMLKYNYCIPLPKVYLQTIAETGTGNDRKKTAYSHHYLYGGNTFWALMALKILKE
jgi:hypothetical protein